MTDHWDPRLVAPSKGAGFVLAFVHHGRAMADSLTTRRGMVSRRRAAKEGASALLKKAVRHPPHDHVIIVFDAV
jgi:hypothetical protein